MKSTFDKNAEKFVNLMVEKIESLSMNWQKPWFSKVNSKPVSYTHLDVYKRQYQCSR